MGQRSNTPILTVACDLVLHHLDCLNLMLVCHFLRAVVELGQRRLLMAAKVVILSSEVVSHKVLLQPPTKTITENQFKCLSVLCIITNTAGLRIQFFFAITGRLDHELTKLCFSRCCVVERSVVDHHGQHHVGAFVLVGSQ